MDWYLLSKLFSNDRFIHGNTTVFEMRNGGWYSLGHVLYTGKIAALFPPQIPISKLGCGDLSRCRLPPVINHSTLTYVCHYPGADCHQSSTIPPWPMCVTIQGQTATSPQPFHPGLCVLLSRGRLPPVIPPWPMYVTIQGQTTTSLQPFHPGLCVSLSRGRLPPVFNHSTRPMCVTIQGCVSQPIVVR